MAQGSRIDGFEREEPMSEPGHSELVALRRQIVSLEEKNGRLSASLATARDRIK